MALELFSLTRGTNEDARILVTRGPAGTIIFQYDHPQENDVGSFVTADADLPPLIEALDYEEYEDMPRRVRIVFDSFLSLIDFVTYRTANLNAKSLFIGLEHMGDTEVYELPLSESEILDKGTGYLRWQDQRLRWRGELIKGEEP